MKRLIYTAICTVCLIGCLGVATEVTPVRIMTSTSVASPTAAIRAAPTEGAVETTIPTNTVPSSRTEGGTKRPTAVPVHTPAVRPSESPSATAAQVPKPSEAIRPSPSPEPSSVASPPSEALHPEVPALVLANYFPWYDPDTWETGCTSGDDRPSAGAYDSDAPETIALHIRQAVTAGLDGFAVHWFTPDDRTATNTGKLLDASPEGFNSTITFLYHILPGVRMSGVVDALRYVRDEYYGHPRFLRLVGKPVVFFADMYRVPDETGARPSSDQDVATAVSRWAAIREAVDPHREAWWIAEGLRSEYLKVFDGLYVYRIDHACCPDACLSAPRWAAEVRGWEEKTGRAKLWVGTAMPGWDDLNSKATHCADLRVSAEPFARDRAEGAYYARTWEAVLPTGPDLIVLHSFNEWVEGSYIEPSVLFGDRYLGLTKEWIDRFKTGP